LDEFLIFPPDRRVFTEASFEEKLIGVGAQFIKFVILDVIEEGGFEVF